MPEGRKDVSDGSPAASPVPPKAHLTSPFSPLIVSVAPPGMQPLTCSVAILLRGVVR